MKLKLTLIFLFLILIVIPVNAETLVEQLYTNNNMNSGEYSDANDLGQTRIVTRLWINGTYGGIEADRFTWNHIWISSDGINFDEVSFTENDSDSSYSYADFDPVSGQYLNFTFTVGGAGYGDTMFVYAEYDLTDSIPPSSITNLTNSTYEHYFINWTWENPADPDFNYTMVYIDGVFEINISNEFYNKTGLNPGTSFTISTKTVDETGNINDTWVNHTATTKPLSQPQSEPESNSGLGSGSINWTYMRNLITGASSLFPSFISLIVNAVPILVILAVVSFVVGFFDKILDAIGSAGRLK